MRKFLTLLLASSLLGACVSNKKHQETLSNIRQNHEAELTTLKQQLTTTTAEKDALTLELAKSSGGNEALLATQDKLQSRIDQLQAEIENIGSQASNQEQSLNNELMNRANEVQQLQEQRTNLQGIIAKWENAQAAIAQELLLALQSSDTDQFAIDQQGGEVIVVLNEDLLFRSGSTSRFQQDGLEALEAISNILLKYPSLYIRVVGHTDNRSIARKSLDNWDYSLLRAGNVAKLLIDEYDLGANRILPAAKSEFAPRTSNETSEGRAENRRIELILSGSSSDLAREIKRALDK